MIGRPFALAVALATLLVPVAGAQQADVLKRGGFEGASGHVTTGSGAIVLQDGRAFVSLGRDFAFDGAPDPRVALGRGGFDGDTILGPLAANSGAQSYALPEGLDPADYDEIWIWCEAFGVPLGVARLR